MMWKPPQRLVHDSLLAAAEASPDRDAISDEFSIRAYGGLLDSALRLARLLQDEGLQRGDRVAIQLDNTADYAVALFGTWLAGGVAMGVNVQTRPEKLAFILSHSEASFLLAEDHLSALADDAVAKAASGVRLFRTSDLGEAIAASEPRPRAAGTIPVDLALLVYTSGTTGRPKGVMLSHESLVFTVGSIAEYLRLDSDERILNVLPFAFTYGLSQLLLAVRLGALLLLERSFAFPAKTLERIRRERATVFAGVPTVYATLINMEHDAPYESVRCLTSAAAALPPSFHADIRRIFPNASLYRMYGLTECVRVCYLEPELLDEKPTSVGRAMPGTEAFVLGNDGSPVAPGEMGVLHVRGPHIMIGYWRDPKGTQEMLKPGSSPRDVTLCTHDHFTVDEEGLLYFVGRTDDIIKTRGEKVSTIEVENVLHAVEGVQQAAVVGVPDELTGHAIRAYVGLEDGAHLSEHDIRVFAREKLESYMVPSEVFILDELPHTESGKIRKRTLLEKQSTLSTGTE
jgi:long-chain acyl-CoA synthetase